MHWCPKRLLQSTRNTHYKKMKTYIYTHTHAHAYICTRTHTRIYDTAQHAETLILRLTTYAQICIHIHIHMYIHAYKYIYTGTCIYIHTCMSVHIHTYTPSVFRMACFRMTSRIFALFTPSLESRSSHATSFTDFNSEVVLGCGPGRSLSVTPTRYTRGGEHI